MYAYDIERIECVFVSVCGHFDVQYVCVLFFVTSKLK